MVESFFDQAVEALILLEKPSDADAETGSIISILIVVFILPNYMMGFGMLVDSLLPGFLRSILERLMSLVNSINKLIVDA